MAIAEISAALGAVKATTELAKAVIGASSSVATASLKLQLAEMMSSLADAKLALVDAQEAVGKVEARNRELEEAFETKATIVRKLSGIYIADANGDPSGDAHCLRCWEVDHKLRHVTHARNTSEPVVCVACKAQYPRNSVPRVAQDG